jgi:hypothetical protein
LVKIAVNGNKIEKEAVYKGKSMTVKF